MSTQTVTTLDVQASDFPIEKQYRFSGKNYLFKFKKNDSGIYTVEVWDSTGKNFLHSNQITYGQTICDSEICPFEDLIIPLNLDKLNGESDLSEINDETFGNQIKLYTDITET